MGPCAIAVDRAVGAQHEVARSVGQGRDGDGGRVLTPAARRDEGLAERGRVERLDDAVGADHPVAPGRRVERDACRRRTRRERARRERAETGRVECVDLAGCAQHVVAGSLGDRRNSNDGGTRRRWRAEVPGIDGVDGRRRRA